jgi:hypothetical protein
MLVLRKDVANNTFLENPPPRISMVSCGFVFDVFKQFFAESG